jgi:hypothetical protein
MVSSRNSARSQLVWAELGVVSEGVVMGSSVAGDKGVCSAEFAGGRGVLLGMAGLERLVATISVVMALTVWAAAVRMGFRTSVGVGVSVGLQAERMRRIRSVIMKMRLFMAGCFRDDYRVLKARMQASFIDGCAFLAFH